VLKTWLLTAHPSARSFDPVGSVPRFELTEVPDDLYGWSVSGRRPPLGLSVWATRHARRPPDSDDPYRIPLPTVLADGWTARFQELTHGLDLVGAGYLDFSLVYHPGWEIAHPLEAEGRAIRLWPRDNRRALDLGSFPLVDARELRWYRGPRLLFAPGAYRTEEREPLSASTRLTFFPPFPAGVTAVTAADG
jgi:hypothetical protein